MADAAAAESRTDADGPTSDAADDFEFCILSSGGLVPAGKAVAETVDMCVADELFCQGKLLPLRPSSATATADGASVVVSLPRSESSAASTMGFVSRSGSRSASSSGSSSGCVSRSESSKSASSDHGGAPPRRSLSSSVFYAHPSPSPQLRSSARPRRSTGSAPPPASWGLFRLGVVGAPDVYPPPRSGEAKITAAAAARGGGSRSARFEQVTVAMDKKLGLGALFGDSLGCKCSPDAIEPVRLQEAAKRSRKKTGGKSGLGVRRIRILDWLEELSIIKEKK
ncbi:hypothetical protein HU200_051790 [Digitaria exilis]|uniref:Uncharacterized protein n=1 Tax=Digitaria exilis TaxID=1010633 RepID=A0A835E658_9POAL|nr:hypothetical protein HU200_051790 [Digitaria exilis]CAB3454824.1 unnamed protein product [Digitaria exilis]